MNYLPTSALERTRAAIHGRLDPKLWTMFQDGDDGEAWTCGDVRVIWSVAKELDDRHWLHVSVSRSTRLPSYSDMTRVKDLFIGDDAIAYSVFAPDAQHVNIHQNCLHLWAPLDGDLPLPDFTRGGRSI